MLASMSPALHCGLLVIITAALIALHPPASPFQGGIILLQVLSLIVNILKTLNKFSLLPAKMLHIS